MENSNFLLNSVCTIDFLNRSRVNSPMLASHKRKAGVNLSRFSIETLVALCVKPIRNACIAEFIDSLCQFTCIVDQIQIAGYLMSAGA